MKQCTNCSSHIVKQKKCNECNNTICEYCGFTLEYKLICKECYIKTKETSDKKWLVYIASCIFLFTLIINVHGLDNKIMNNSDILKDSVLSFDNIEDYSIAQDGKYEKSCPLGNCLMELSICPMEKIENFGFSVFNTDLSSTNLGALQQMRISYLDVVENKNLSVDVFPRYTDYTGFTTYLKSVNTSYCINTTFSFKVSERVDIIPLVNTTNNSFSYTDFAWFFPEDHFTTTNNATNPSCIFYAPFDSNQNITTEGRIENLCQRFGGLNVNYTNFISTDEKNTSINVNGSTKNVLVRNGSTMLWDDSANPSLLFPNNDFTYTFWFNSSVNGFLQTFLYVQDNTPYIQLERDTNLSWFLTMRDSSGAHEFSKYISPTADFPYGYHNYALVYKDLGSSIEYNFFVDGVVRQNETFTFGDMFTGMSTCESANGNCQFFARWNKAPARAIISQVDEVRLYNISLNPSQIYDIYNIVNLSNTSFNNQSNQSNQTNQSNASGTTINIDVTPIANAITNSTDKLILFVGEIFVTILSFTHPLGTLIFAGYSLYAFFGSGALFTNQLELFKGMYIFTIIGISLMVYRSRKINKEEIEEDD